MLPMDPRLAKAARRDKAAGAARAGGPGREAARAADPGLGRRAPARGHCHGRGPRPEMLFADEPTGSVDTDTGRDIMEFVVHTSRAGGRDAHHRKHNPEVAALADASCA